MKRMDEDKASLVDFLRSIKFARNNKSKHRDEEVGHFADFNPQAGAPKHSSAEDSKLVRSAN
jgi:hypothetical protein